MNNEDILNAARNNKYRGKEYETKASTRSNLWGALVAFFVGVFLFLLEYFMKGTVNIGLIAVGMSASCVQSFYEGVKTKKICLVVIGAVQALIALFTILAFISQVVSA